MLGTVSLLAEVRLSFSSHFCLVVRDLCVSTLYIAGKTLGTFWKLQNLILSEKNQCVLMTKISFRKTEKSPVCKNKLSQKFHTSRYTHLACFVSTINKIGIFTHLFTVSVQTV